jgi:sporulation protein YlmC with PRC-barrel domain
VHDEGTGTRFKGKEELEMNKTKKILITLGSVFCVVLFGSSAFSQALSEQYPPITVGAAFQPLGWSSYEASELIGYHVITPTGATLGQINSLVIDRTNGRVALVVLSDVPNIGGEVLAIPYSSLTKVGPNTWGFNPGSMEVSLAAGAGYVYQDPYVYALTYHPSYSEFYGLPSEIDAAWLTEIYRHYGQVPYWKEKEGKEPKAMELYKSDRLMGAEVKLADGDAAGKINDFVIDSSDGHIAFLVLSDVPGRSTALVAVPFSILTSRGGDAFVLNTTQDHLAMARSFESGHLNNSRWAGDVYRYFGQQPYWTEEMRMTPASEESEGM